MRQAQTTFGTRRSQFYRPRPTFGAVGPLVRWRVYWKRSSTGWTSGSSGVR